MIADHEREPLHFPCVVLINARTRLENGSCCGSWQITPTNFQKHRYRFFEVREHDGRCKSTQEPDEAPILGARDMSGLDRFLIVVANCLSGSGGKVPAHIVWSFLEQRGNMRDVSHTGGTSLRTITEDRNQRQLYKCTKVSHARSTTRRTCAWDNATVFWASQRGPCNASETKCNRRVHQSDEAKHVSCRGVYVQQTLGTD